MVRVYFRDQILINSAVAGTNQLKHDVVEPGKFYNYEEIVFEDRSNNFDRLLIGVVSGGLFHTYEEQQDPKANTLYPFHPNKTLKLHEGEQLLLECYNVTAGDKLVLHVAGYYDIKDGGNPAEGG